MTLNEILEENSVAAISKKTMISEENIEYIIAEEFSALVKAKALGFISILERDYHADLKALREKAIAYYDEHKKEEESINIALPRIEEKKGRSKWFPLLMLGLLAYASWYFFTQFDKKMLSTMLPFSEDKVEVPASKKVEAPIKTSQVESKKEESLSIVNALTATQTDATGAQTDIVVASIDPSRRVTPQRETVMQTSSHMDVAKPSTHALPTFTKAEPIVLMPEHKLWFGIIDINTGKRDHFSISNKYEIDVKEKSWLIATSSAPFSFINQEKTQEFNDAKEHYFKVSKEGVESLSKAEYVSQGGYRKW